MDAFVEAMNQKAKELGMKNSHFENPSGIDGSNHYSTPRDITFLTSVALKNPTILDIVKTKQTVVADITGKRIYRLKNVNQLLGTVAGVDGVKTGFTTEAGQCLVTSATRNGHKIVIVLMGSADRFGESAKLVDWAFSNFQWFSFKELMSQSSN
jgi:D-alanyl-D-alanine carboxypeptidase